MKTLYLKLKERLKGLPVVKTAGLFNNQFTNLDQEKAFRFPAAFIEFPEDTVYSDVGNGIQKAVVRVRLHVAIETKKDEDMNVFDIPDAVHVAIQGYASEGFTPLKRVGGRMDFNHDNVIVRQLDYLTEITDTSTAWNRNRIKFKIDNLDVQGEIENTDNQ